MIAMSTSWAAGSGLSADALLQKLDDLPLEGVEIDYRVDPACFHDLKNLLKSSRLAVVSLHNYCPCPDLVKGRPASGDYFNLADLDREARQIAVQWTMATMEHAVDLEASLVVLHCGKIPENNQDRLFRKQLAVCKQDEIDSLRPGLAERVRARELMSAKCLDALLFSLDSLVSYAVKLNLTLGIENRYYWNELPSFEELDKILDTFRGAPLGYWHDMGHARAQEQLSLVQPGALLGTYGKSLVGIHVHDAVGLLDHLPPGKGELDFRQLKQLIENDPPLVIELSPGTNYEQIRAGVEYLRQCLGLAFTAPVDFALDSKDFII